VDRPYDPDVDHGALAPVVDAVRALLPAPRSMVVGVAGGVAVGKTTVAATIAECLVGTPVQIVATDGFLLPNAEIARRGLAARKGFPESYDEPALLAFLDAVRNGEVAWAPVYSHETYDVVPGASQRVAGAAVVVLEGLNALRAPERLDLAVYLDASEGAMEDWYARRFVELCADPPPGSFYSGFSGLDLVAIDAIARDVWRAVNLPNLRDHIEPTRAMADLVVEKRPDHSVAAVRVTRVRA